MEAFGDGVFALILVVLKIRSQWAVMSDEREAAEDRRRLGGGAIASLTGLGVLLIFIIQNTEDVRFNFLFLDFIWPLWLYTIFVAAFGAMVWIGVGAIRRHRRRKARREDRRD